LWRDNELTKPLDSKMAKWLDFAEKAGIGFLITVIGALAIGRYNNSMVVSISGYRQPVMLSGDSTNHNDYVVLSIKLKKTGSTRVRINECEISLISKGGETKNLDVISKKLSEEFSQDFKISTGAGIALVADDEVSYEGCFEAPRDSAIHIKIILEGTQKIMEIIPIGWPNWSSSLIILPSKDNTLPLDDAKPAELQKQTEPMKEGNHERSNNPQKEEKTDSSTEKS
jgi:hypothetical protein